MTATATEDLLTRALTVSRGVVAASAEEVDAESRFPGESLRALHEAGLMAIFLPAGMGGHDASVVTYAKLAALLAEECASTGMVWAMHGQQLVSLLDHGATSHAEQLERAGAEGFLIGSVTTDAEGGADLLTTGPALVPEGGRLRVRRDAPVVTGGSCAGMYLVTMRADADSPPTRTRLVCVTHDDGVVEECGDWDALGMRGTRSRPMRFDVVVDPERVLGVPFAQIARSTMIPVGHVGWASCWLGVARGAAARTREALRASGGPRSDVLFGRLAEVRLSLDLLESFVLRVAEAVDRARDMRRAGLVPDPLDPVMVNNLKLAGARLAFAAVDDLVELMGMRDGYLRGRATGLERAFRDLRSASLMFHDDRLLQANGRLVLMGGRGLAELSDAAEPPR